MHTMVHPLERLLIYTDKERIDDFKIPDAEYDELYELYITSKDDVLEEHHTSIDFFNEVFYDLTRIYANDNAAENLNPYLYNGTSLFPSIPELENPQTRQEEKQAQEYAETIQEACYYILGFVWTILKKQKEIPRHVRFFLIALEHALEESYSEFYIFEDFVKEHDTKYSLVFDINPEFDDVMYFCAAQEWKDATNDFDKVVIEEIVRRFNKPDAREALVGEIRKALASANQDPNSSPKVSMVSHRLKANDKFLNELLTQIAKEDEHIAELEQAIEKSKDERIKELEAQVQELQNEKRLVIRDKINAERERDLYREKLNTLSNRMNGKYIPASLKSEEAELIINELMRKDLITPMGINTETEYKIQFYRWDGSKALFGYFVDKMSFQLELYDSGGHINWKEFKPAFSNFEDIVKRARDTVSNYKQHPEVKMPEKAEIIDDAIAKIEKSLANRKPAPSLPKIGMG